MELKHVLRLLSLSVLLIHPASALSISSVLDQINDYIASPLSIFSPLPQGGKSPFAAAYPCCICSRCTCSHTSCPFIVPFPRPPIARWPVNDTTPIEIATAGCGANYSLKACLNFVQQYLHALQPALESTSNHSHHHYDVSSESEEEGPSEGYRAEGKKGKKKVPCCGDGCSGAQCLRYLAVAVKNLQAPINGTLESVETGADAGNKTPVPEEPEEVVKSEL
jgi:hypothetical protein